MVRTGEYRRWPECYILENGKIELVVCTGIGPRVIRLGRPGGPNAFVEYPEQLEEPKDQWHFYGGHRLWHSPEDLVRTYQPDNKRAAEVLATEDSLEVIQETEEKTGLQKALRLQIDPVKPRCVVEHRLTNRGLWPIETAARAISPMAEGGLAIAPLRGNGKAGEKLPDSKVVLWPYTAMDDPRLNWGRELVCVAQNPGMGDCKIGLQNGRGWIAYLNRGELFLVRFLPTLGAVYPDMGAEVEIFTKDIFTEVETLGPLTRLEPGETLKHTEVWYYFTGFPEWENEGELAELIADYLQQAPFV